MDAGFQVVCVEKNGDECFRRDGHATSSTTNVQVP